MPYINSAYIAPFFLLIGFGLVFYFNREGLTGILDFTATADKTSFANFTEKIPYLVFVPFTVVMTILCIVKRLSLIPVLGVMCCTYLMTELGWTNWFRFAVWLIVGFIVYFFYSFSHSKLHNAPEWVAEDHSTS